MADVRLQDLIAPSFYPVHHAMKNESVTELWLKGGRGSTKSSFASIEIIQGMLRDREANAIAFRKIAGTLRDSVFNQLLWAIERLGVSAYFKATVSPLEIVLKPTGQKIMFRGADDPNKTKSIKLKNGFFKFLWFEELPEFSGMEEIGTIKASVRRGNGGHGFTIMTYNPPRSSGNWVNAETVVPTERRMVHHSTYLTVPEDWLGANFIADAEALLNTNERAYRHMYLGEVTGSGGQVFDNLELREITRAERERFDHFLNGGDFGFANDPDAVVRCHFDKRSRMLYLLNEVYGIRMNIDELARRVSGLIGREYVTYDSEDPRMINELQRRNVHALPAKKGPGSVEHGMRWLQDLAAIVIDPQACPNAAREFSGYEYQQDRFGNFLSNYPDKDNHTIDAIRYATESARIGGLGFAKTLSQVTPKQRDRIFSR